MTTPPNELAEYVLKLLRLYRQNTEALMLHQVVALEQRVESTPSEIRTIRESLRPSLIQTFQKAEEELLSGREPLLVLRDFLGKPE